MNLYFWYDVTPAVKTGDLVCSWLWLLLWFWSCDNSPLPLTSSIQNQSHAATHQIPCFHWWRDVIPKVQVHQGGPCTGGPTGGPTLNRHQHGGISSVLVLVLVQGWLAPDFLTFLILKKYHRMSSVKLRLLGHLSQC